MCGNWPCDFVKSFTSHSRVSFSSVGLVGKPRISTNQSAFIVLIPQWVHFQQQNRSYNSIKTVINKL